MTTTDHPASRACYLRGCNQPSCRDQHLRYCKQYQYDAHNNGPRTTDATPYITQVQALVNAGWTHAAIAGDIGICVTVIRDLAAGEARRVANDTATRLDHHQPADTPPNWWVDVTGTMRRLQALTVMGWSQEAQAAALGLGYSTIRAIANGRRTTTPRRTADAVTALYAKWSRRPGPSLSAAGRARARGWAGPLAWGHNTIDNPSATPDMTGVGPIAHRRRDPDRPAEIEHLAGFGLSIDTIAKQVHLSPKDTASRMAKLRKTAPEEQVAA